MKKLVKKFLKKRLTAHPKNYYFLRWLVSIVENSNVNREVLRCVVYYTQENKINLPFLDIFVIDKDVYIVTERPGLWIGKAGSIIDGIRKCLNYNLKGEKIRSFDMNLIEDTFSSAEYFNCYRSHILNNY